MGLLFFVVAAVIALICAWLVNSIVAMLSGDRPESLGGTWWNIFSRMGSNETSYAEPPPDALRPRRFIIGEKIRVVRVSSNAEHSVSPERQELLKRCVGKVLRVQRIDGLGTLELHVLDDGSQAPDRSHHIVFVDQKDAEPVTKV